MLDKFLKVAEAVFFVLFLLLGAATVTALAFELLLP